MCEPKRSSSAPLLAGVICAGGVTLATVAFIVAYWWLLLLGMAAVLLITYAGYRTALRHMGTVYVPVTVPASTSVRALGQSQPPAIEAPRPALPLGWSIVAEDPTLR
jgi:hypothetical protein